MSEQVIIDIDADGNVKVEAKGVVGKGCQALTDGIERALGKKVAEELKPEFHQQPSVQKNQQRQ